MKAILSILLLTNLIEENKRLKAERDALLEALKRFIAFADKQNLEYESSLIRQCKAAIAKATGKPI